MSDKVFKGKIKDVHQELVAHMDRGIEKCLKDKLSEYEIKKCEGVNSMDEIKKHYEKVFYSRVIRLGVTKVIDMAF